MHLFYIQNIEINSILHIGNKKLTINNNIKYEKEGGGKKGSYYIEFIIIFDPSM